MNLRIEREKVLYELHKPFDIVLDQAKSLFWRPLIQSFKNKEITFDFALHRIKTLFSSFKIEVDER